MKTRKQKSFMVAVFSLLALLLLALGFGVAGAWFWSKDELREEAQLGQQVELTLQGTGENGEIRNHQQIYKSTTRAFPGDKILDTISIKMGENTMESALRVQYAVNILDGDGNVKTTGLEANEQELLTLFSNDIKAKSSFEGSDWSENDGWLYYNHLAGGTNKSIKLFDEYKIPYTVENDLARVSFGITLTAEAIQAANLWQNADWATKIEALETTQLYDLIAEYNASRHKDAQAVACLKLFGDQYIDTGVTADNGATVEVTFSTDGTKGGELFNNGSGLSASVSGTNQVSVNGGAAQTVEGANFANKTTLKFTGTNVSRLSTRAAGSTGDTLVLGNNFTGKIYGVKVWENDKLTRAIVPTVTQENKAGLYELVGKNMLSGETEGNVNYEYAIEYYFNGGTLPSNAPRSYDPNTTLTLVAPERVGYAFRGWYTSSDLTGIPLTEIAAGTMNQKINLYAKWEKAYEITYVLDGGTLPADAPLYFTAEDLPLTLPTPEKTGYDFVGWYTDSTFTNEVTEVTSAQDITLYAKYEFNDDRLVFTLNSDNESYSVKAKDSSISGEIVIPSAYKRLPVTIIPVSAFAWCSGLNSIIIPDSVMSIGASAFQGCTKMTSITIPDSVTSIGNTAFYNCNELKSIINIPNVTSIGKSAFYGCSGVIEFGDIVETTPLGSALSGFKGTIVIKDCVASIGEKVFNQAGMTSISIPNSVKSIGMYAFQSCSLTSITIPDSITSIADYTFLGCTKLTSITIPDSVTSIGDYVFQYCSGLTSITIPNSVTSIGQYAFQGCTKMTSIAIPDSVTSIGGCAFKDCTAEIYVGSVISKDLDISSGGSYSPFCNLKGKVIIRNGVKGIGKCAFMSCGKMTDINIPDSVTSIGQEAFSNCSGLTSITIPDSVESIGSSAFYGCSGLTSITIPDSVTSIGDRTFNGCSGLTSITIPDSVTSIGSYAFSGCSVLASITIPDRVISVGACMFYGCSGLISIVIPNGVEKISANAFSGCSALEKVYYGGADEGKWSSMNISSTGNDTLTSATRYYYSETQKEGNYWHYVDGVPTKWN